MRIGFIVNDVQSEKANYTTTNLALCASSRGHQVFYMGVGDLAYFSDGLMGAHAHQPENKKFRMPEPFLKNIQDSKKKQINASDLDVLLLRNDPSEDIELRPWAQNSGVIFGQLASKQGVIVLNDPFSLGDAMNKLYFQYFPEKVRPRTVISRDKGDIKDFFKECNHRMILKPLQGSGGRNVFLATKEQSSNLNQMIDAIGRDGYIIAQEYLPMAKNGDVRLFLMNGNPISINGKIAAVHRYQSKEDIRSNLHIGGTAGPAVINETIEELVELIRPKLIQDGMFLVGVDIVGDKLMEVNVFSPGGLYTAGKLNSVDYHTEVIKSIEKKHYYKQTYKADISNSQLAVL